MLQLTTSEIISKIENGECFEASHNGDFYIKIQDYVPFVCAAIHDGDRLREELQEQCMLTEDERYYEESPFTGEFIRSLPITLIGGDSRYEYDLNRSADSCVYDFAWGKQVWKTPLNEEQKARSIQKHTNFYAVVHALIKKLETQFSSAIVYDIHSYNYKRHEESYLFNIGVENLDVARYNKYISDWKRQLSKIKINKVITDVSVNHIYYGRGELLSYIKQHFNNTLVLATEIKKVYMDELTGQEYPVVIQSISKSLKRALLENSRLFINSQNSVNILKRSSLLNSDIQPEVLKLDADLQSVIKGFEILGYVNPINIEQEKKKFFKNNFSVNPDFKYKHLTIDPHVFKSKMYKLDVDRIEDIHIRQIYIDIIKSYADKVDMLSSLGTENFLYNSLRYFGEPSPKDMANANFLLYCNELPQFEEEEKLSLDKVKKMFEVEAESYGFNFNVEIMDSIPSDALVLSSQNKIVLKKGAVFTPSRVHALLNHEIGVHMVTTMNARSQPLRFLSLGLPKNTYTQEGLAIMSELKSGCLSIARLRELALRVLAVNSLAKGLDFKTTFEKMYAEQHINPDKLFYLVTRVYRGGGFTKDYLYLRGFRRILQMEAKGVNMDNLFIGKTSHSYLTVLNEMVDRGYLLKPQYKCNSFKNPQEIDVILKYLCDSIK